MRKIILSLLLCILALPTMARKLTVLSVSGRPVVISDSGRKPMKVGDELTDNTVVSIPYNSSIDLVDREAHKQYHIKTPGRDPLRVFLANGKNGVSNVTQKYLKYVTEQVNGGMVRAQRVHSDAATITRQLVVFNPQTEDNSAALGNGDGPLSFRDSLRLAQQRRREANRQSHDQFRDSVRTAYQAFRDSVIQEYEKFRAEVNEHYAQFMADPWESYKKEEPEPQPQVPEVKPLVIPKGGKDRLPPLKSVPIKVDPDNVNRPELPTPQPLPVLPIVQDEQATVVDPVVIPAPVPEPEPILAPKPEIEVSPLDEPEPEPVVQPTPKPVVEPEPVVQPTPKPVVEPDPVVTPLPAPVGREVLFFGTKLYVREPLLPLKLKSLDEKAIAEAWRDLSDTDFNNTIADCLTIRRQMHLSDWAYLQLLQRVGAVLAGEGTNESTLLTAYIYCQSGYKMRLGKSATRLYMLFASRHKIYNHDYFIMNGENFYPLNCNESEMGICSLPYPEEQALSLELTDELILAKDVSPRRSLVNDISPKMQADVSVNKNLIDFYNTYPTSEIGGNLMTRWAMYANTPLASDVSEQLYPELKAQLAGLSKREAVGRLLAFVQHSLEYKYDEDVWGYDRAFFAEETLFYDYADCEDRSILFSRLVRDLLGLRVVLVFYPGHLATAVEFDEQVPGDYIPLDGHNFVVCDPTYIGAPIGRSMPGLDQNAIKVILLNN